MTTGFLETHEGVHRAHIAQSPASALPLQGPLAHNIPYNSFLLHFLLDGVKVTIKINLAWP